MQGPNMTYCMCENTRNAVRQIHNELGSNFPARFAELSKSEQSTLRELLEMAQELHDELRHVDNIDSE